eukprot:m.37516 g.37516  ORF g.37516 m.37516 type:complete len:110 (+) comp32391_c0_seq1:1712-2041(+)
MEFSLADSSLMSAQPSYKNSKAAAAAAAATATDGASVAKRVKINPVPLGKEAAMRSQPTSGSSGIPYRGSYGPQYRAGMQQQQAQTSYGNKSSAMQNLTGMNKSRSRYK